MTTHACEVGTRFGPVSLVVHEGSVIGGGYHRLDELLPRVLRRHPSLEIRTVESAASPVSTVVNALGAYDDGELDVLQAVPAHQPGPEFMQALWRELRAVRAGTTVSYAQLASAAGRPAAVRAAGTACSSNLVAPFVPCHRVIRSGGSLGNYGFGMTLKRTLLGHEGALEQGKLSGR
jgi:methylated-DNA-[protein]-cysteine S-methyltransferase